jgi:sugar/nucleoside kinase (ribokinase family)
MFKEDTVDFLAIGHICRDLIPGGAVIGGASAYAAATAHALGCRAAIVSSAAPDVDWSTDLPGVLLRQHPSEATTTFENVYTPAGRVQTLHAVGGRLGAGQVPAGWWRAPMIMLAPIADEVDPALISLFSNSLVGVSPQGWMRRWGADGRVYAVPWEASDELLCLAAAVFLSAEDLADPDDLAEYRRRTRLLVLTDGAHGCTVYYQGAERTFPAPQVEVVESTGAGDVFGASFLVRLFQTHGDPWEAARFANVVAAESVTRRGLAAKVEAVRRAAVEMSRGA